ncbi:MAG: tetratricopeptide repeat protein [Candidatus Aminicenantes bacterium]|nr:tetratricopeptide repeat protein [Candidatus Aminicenantes bacterium]
MKRDERHHIKEDGLAVGLRRLMHFFKAWRKQLLMLAGVAALAALVFVAIGLIRGHSLRAQSEIATQILKLRADLDQKPENLAQLEKLAGRGRYARLAHVELATYWIQKGDLDKAAASLKEVTALPKDLIYYQAQDLAARIEVRRKNYDQAIELYKKLEADDTTVYPLDVILFHRAEAHELKGETKEARELYERLQTEFSQTYYGYEASTRAAKLGTG